MACTTEWGVLLSRLADGEVTPDEKNLVESHLAGCSTCKQTQELFGRNEKVLESALAGEAFGDMVVEGVMAEIRRIEMPPIVAPAVDGPSWRARLVRRWPIAAAAAGLLLVLGAILMTRPPDYTDRLAALEDRVLQAQDTNRMLSDLIADYSRELAERSIRDKSYGDVVENKSISVRCVFAEREKFDSFEVQRSQDDGKTWTTLDRSLKEPIYEDRKVQPGVLYWYRFIGIGKDGTVVAAPVHVRVPLAGELDATNSLKITFIVANVDLTKATFEVQRHDNGGMRREWFTVRIGETLGAIVEGVDYRTNLILDKLSLGDELLYPGERAITRLNKKARLRATDGSTAEIWRGGFRLIPIPAR